LALLVAAHLAVAVGARGQARAAGAPQPREEWRRIVARAERMPPSRTVCSFDLDPASGRGLRHAEVEWDPIVGGALVRSVVLPAPGYWLISCRSDPLLGAAGGRAAWSFQHLLRQAETCSGARARQGGDCGPQPGVVVGSPPHDQLDRLTERLERAQRTQQESEARLVEARAREEQAAGLVRRLEEELEAAAGQATEAAEKMWQVTQAEQLVDQLDGLAGALDSVTPLPLPAPPGKEPPGCRALGGPASTEQPAEETEPSTERLGPCLAWARAELKRKLAASAKLRARHEAAQQARGTAEQALLRARQGLEQAVQERASAEEAVRKAAQELAEARAHRHRSWNQPFVAVFHAGEGAPAARVHFTPTRLPSLRDAQLGLSGRSQAYSAPRFYQPGLGQAATAADNLLQAAAEVAVARAQADGLRRLQRRLTEWVCQQQPGEAQRGPTLLLPRSCELLRSLRLADLGGAGRALQEALAQDLVQAVLRATERRLMIAAEQRRVPPELSEHLLQLGSLVALASGPRAEAAGGAADSLLVKLSRVPWLPTRPNPGPTLALDCNAALAFAVLAECSKSASCDAARVADLLHAPGTYFALEECAPPADGGWLAPWDGAASVVEAGSRVVRPPKGSSGRDRVQAVVVATLALTELYAGARCTEQACRPATVAELTEAGLQVPSGGGGDALRAVASARRVALGVLSGDLHTAVAAGGSLLGSLPPNEGGLAEGQRRQYERAVHLLGALAAYAASDPRDGSAESHNSRKAALEALVAAATRRSERDAGFVLSVGSTVCPLSSVAYGLDGGWIWTPMSVTLGLSAEYLPQRGVGLHLELSPLDLGHYVGQTATPDGPEGPFDAVVPSASLGLLYLLRDSETPLTLTLRGAWVPRSEELQVGLWAGVHVPFVDLN